MEMIYSLGNISGALFNPAVTIAFTLAKKCELKQVLPYIISQLMGALLASLTLKFLFTTNETLGATLPSGTQVQSFILEFILTSFLMLVMQQFLEVRGMIKNYCRDFIVENLK